MSDMKDKGRSTYGEKHPKAILTEDQVLTIRRLAKTTTASRREIAQMYGVSKSAIAGILSGRSWKYLNHEKPSTVNSREVQGIETQSRKAGVLQALLPLSTAVQARAV